jgi:hypothetical protein
VSQRSAIDLDIQEDTDMIRIRHNPSVPALVGAGVLLASTAALATDDVNVVTRPPLHHVSAEEAAVTSCLTAFIQQLFPAQRPVVHTVILRSHEIWHPSRGIDTWVGMQAALRSSGKLIARGECVASPGAHVKRIHTDIVNASLLAASVLKDLSVMLADR